MVASAMLACRANGHSGQVRWFCSLKNHPIRPPMRTAPPPRESASWLNLAGSAGARVGPRYFRGPVKDAGGDTLPFSTFC